MVNWEEEQIRDRLWNDAVGPVNYKDAGEKYQAAILDQYKLYVEMADRVSQRRGATNTFFLTLNSAVFTVIGVFWKAQLGGKAWLLVFPLVIALGQCAAWWSLIRTYSRLRSAKYVIIGLLEERLPACPYWRAEWIALDENQAWRKYLPVIRPEQTVPILFGLVYLVGFICVVASRPTFERAPCAVPIPAAAVSPGGRVLKTPAHCQWGSFSGTRLGLERFPIR